MDDLISRQAAIEYFKRIIDATNTDGRYNLGFIDGLEFCINHLSTEPSAQPEQPTEVQDILQYLDEYLHPIVSPEHWSVYSELYDMISMLPSAQPEQKKGKWTLCENPIYSSLRIVTADPYLCTVCDMKNDRQTKYCPNCGADMGGN